MRYQFKDPKPWPHQVRALRFILPQLEATGGSGLFVPLRFGKSRIAIDAAGALHLKHNLRRVLVVTTTSGMGVWHNEIRKYVPEGVELDWRIVHHQLTYDRVPTGEGREWVSAPNKAIEAFDPEMVIVDEAHRIGDPSTVQSKMCYKYGRKAKYRLILTGTPWHRGVPVIFGQVKFMDDSLFGTAVTAFRRQYIQYGGYGNYEIVGFKNLHDLSKKIKSSVFVMDKPPPKQPPVVTVTPVALDRSLSAYQEMEKESIIQVKDREITAPIILTRHLRLQQIAGGWVKSEGSYFRVGSEKRDVLLDKLTAMREQDVFKIVIGCRFIPELRDVAKAARTAGFRVHAIHGGVPVGEARDARIAAFSEGEEPCVMVCQVAAAAEAIDLSAADTLIFYSLPESLVIHDQFRARIEKYDEKRTLLYDYLIATGTRDEVTWVALRMKTDVARLLLKRPDIVERITARLDA